jgi:hypothetical protein
MKPHDLYQQLLTLAATAEMEAAALLAAAEEAERTRWTHSAASHQRRAARCHGTAYAYRHAAALLAEGLKEPHE